MHRGKREHISLELYMLNFEYYNILNEKYIREQSRGMDLCRTYVDLGTAIDKDKIVNLHHLSDQHLAILERSVKKEVGNRNNS